MLPLDAASVRTLIENRSEPDPNSGCWLWTGTVTREGYGVVFMGGHRTGRQWSAHRLSVAAHHGPIPAGMVVDHKCRTRSCCNPAHLRVVTARVNLLENSTNFIAENAKKTHCKWGHELTSENIYLYPAGRVCRPCVRARDKCRREAARQKRLQEKAAAYQAVGGVPMASSFRRIA
jgi:hypothetical protein